MKTNFTLLVAFFCVFLNFSQAVLPVNRTSNWDTASVTGWTHSGTSDRISVFACTGNNAETFDTNTDRIVLFFNAAPNQLIFKLKSAGMSGASSLLVEQSVDGTTYTNLGTFGTASGATLITDCADITILLNNTTRYLRWTYTKATGNVDIDDVRVNAASATTTITTGTITGSPFCVGNGASAAVSIPFTIAGTYTGLNTFTAQLSDAVGGFTSPTSLGALTQTTAGTIAGTIPATITAGTGYRIRVIASTPAIIGSINGANLTIQNFAAPTALAVVCGNTTTTSSWTNPACFDQVMLVATNSSFTTAIPSGNGTAYTANLAFGSGTGFDGGFVIFKGTAASSGTITGLTNGTNYTYKIFVRTGTFWLAGNTTSCIPFLPNSTASDLVYVAGSAAATISSTVNTAVLTSTTGVQVMNFTIRDGGGTTDVDTVPTILTGFTISQGTGNQVAIWNNAIQSISLFDGATKLADGTVSATTIVFSGLNASTITDGGTKTLSLRLSLRCPLLGATADGQDFVFSITKANTQFANTGSGSATAVFPVVTNPNDTTNLISVVATQLLFLTQPVTTGVSASMAKVVVRSTDVCGNNDINFIGQVSLTSSGTMTGEPLLLNAVLGVATYTGLVHTVAGLGLTMTATATGLSSVISSNFDIAAITILEKGDLAILAVNTTNTASADEFSFVCFKDILPGTQIYFTDNGYERITAGLWGDTEGVFSITRTGTTLIKGTIINIECIVSGGINDPSDFTVSTCGILDANWTKTVISPSSVFFNLNKDDQIWITQGGAWANLDNVIAHNATYSGTVLYGWTEIAWKTAPNYASTAGSTIFPGNRCYSTDINNTANADAFSKFNDPINPDFSTTTRDKIDWIAVINDPANWTNYPDNATYNTIAANTNYDYKGSTTCPALTITAGTFVDGAWTGLKDTNWFNCNNWDTLEVPLATSNVTLASPKAIRVADISAIATDAALFGSIAKCNNLTVSSQKVTLNGNANNKLEVNGNLIINGTGGIDMTDGVAGTPDGEISLTGNWTNSRGEGFFNEGEGTVIFKGTTTQNVTCALGTPENFFNVTLDNTFTTDNFNSDLIAKGNLDIRPSKNLTVKTGHYALAGKNLTVGLGSILEIEDDASLTQTDDSGIVTNNGTTRVLKNSTPFVQYDYNYWASPIVAETKSSVFAANNPNRVYTFNPAQFLDMHNADTNGGSGYPQSVGTSDTFDDNGNVWSVPAPTAILEPAKGYIAMGPTAMGPTGQAVVFTETGANGRLNNGLIPVTVSKDLYNNTLGSTGAPTFHNNLNLLGNPYASAIDLVKLKADNNALLTGTFYFWTHKTPISVANPGPWVYNFTNNDYVTFTVGTGGNASSCSGCPVPDQYVDSCQGFFANVTDNGTVNFNNSQRVTGNNSSFYRPATATPDKIWLNFTAVNGETRQALVGFIEGSTDDYNPYYDGARLENGSGYDFYSYIASNPTQRLAVQGLEVFNDQKTVPLGLEIIAAGTHKIGVDHSEGVFNAGQAIFLQDNVTGTTHDFANGDYLFQNEIANAINNRFVLRFTNPSLGISDVDLQNNNVLITSKNDVTNIKSNILKIDKVLVYDVLGRELLNKNKVNDFEFSITKNWSKQALIVKIVLENGEVVSKKIVN